MYKIPDSQGNEGFFISFAPGDGPVAQLDRATAF